MMTGSSLVEFFEWREFGGCLEVVEKEGEVTKVRYHRHRIINGDNRGGRPFQGRDLTIDMFDQRGVSVAHRIPPELRASPIEGFVFVLVGVPHVATGYRLEGFDSSGRKEVIEIVE